MKNKIKKEKNKLKMIFKNKFHLIMMKNKN